MNNRVKEKERSNEKTFFSEIYERFLNNVTTDMYLLITPNETIRLLQTLLISSINGFTYPRFPRNKYVVMSNRIYSDYELDENGEKHIVDKVDDDSYYDLKLSNEEIEIITDLMTVKWISQQLINGDLIKMTYSGADFKGSSQANHISRLNALRDSFDTIAQKHMFDYSKSFEDEEGYIISSFGDLISGNQSQSYNLGTDKLFYYNRFRRR